MESLLIYKLSLIIRFQYFLITLLLASFAWLFYFFFLRQLSQERHQIFNRQFRNLASYIAVFTLAFFIHKLFLMDKDPGFLILHVALYSGLFIILMGSIVVNKTMKIIAYEYFFFNSQSAGVPLLLVNVCSLILAMLIFGWVLTALFDVQITSVLTTSAVLTIVLGLALQDTLGNLFAAISLQIDKPFELDDWIELRSGSEKISGQVKELSWRATVLLAITDEYITIPNRTLAQWQILNFSARMRPFYRGHFFRIPFGASVERAKTALLNAVKTTPEILQYPAPLVLIIETTESWITLKVSYAVSNYGSQYSVADKFLAQALIQLKQNGISLATPRLSLDKNESSVRASPN